MSDATSTDRGQFLEFGPSGAKMLFDPAAMSAEED